MGHGSVCLLCLFLPDVVRGQPQKLFLLCPWACRRLVGKALCVPLCCQWLCLLFCVSAGAGEAAGAAQASSGCTG